MKKSLVLHFILLSIGAIFLNGCSNYGLQISGKIQNAANLQVILEEVHLEKDAIKALEKSEISSDGSFSIKVKDAIQKGIYRLRIGTQQIVLILDSDDNKIEVNADLTTLSKFTYEVKGSELSSKYAKNMADLVIGQNSVESIKNTALNVDPLLGMVLAISVFGQDPKFLDVQKSLCQKMNASYSGSQDAKDYAAYIAQMQMKDQQAAPQVDISIGKQAPDIALPGLDGTIHKLSSLKGKVVLLDFWASWCRPCRMANPHVVELYKKYKSKGFTVFSVSLDGVDARIRVQLSPDNLKQYMDNAHHDWQVAIQQDGLEWENHVSDLQKWDSQAAKLYGVNAIPQAFVIDQKGNISAIINPGANPEQEILKLL